MSAAPVDNRATRSLRVAHRLRYGVGAARSTGFFKTENSKISGSRRRWSTRSVVHGRRLGCFAVEGVGKAGTRRAVPALVVGAAALSMPGTGHRARRWNTKEKRPFRAAGVVQGLQPLFQAIIECHVLGNPIDALSHQRQRSAFGHQRAIKANG